MIEISLAGHASKIHSDTNASLGFAGDTLNTAIYLKRLIGNRASVSFVSALGTDRFSEQMITMMESENIATTHIEFKQGRLPGLYAVTIDDSGERSFYYWRDNSAARLMFQSNGKHSFADLAAFDVIYLSAISLAILPEDVRYSLLNWLEEYRKQPGKLIAFDSNFRPQLWASISDARKAISAAWSIADIALPSIDDEMALFDETTENEVLHRLRDAGIKQGVLKRGALGPLAISGSAMTESDTRLEFSRVENVVDSTAAGDSFNGAYLAMLLSGQTESEAILAGHLCASRVISFAGAIIPKDNMPPACQ